MYRRNLFAGYLVHQHDTKRIEKNKRRSTELPESSKSSDTESERSWVSFRLARLFVEALELSTSETFSITLFQRKVVTSRELKGAGK